jgi:xylulokinase
MSYVIGCDIGSQAVKAVLLDAGGRLLAEAGARYGIDYPQPAWAEQEASDWIAALAQSVRQVVAAAGVSPAEVAAIGLDAQVDGVVAVDAGGRPLHPAIIWMDRRATAQCAAAEHLTPQQIFAISGLNLDASHVAPKIRWLADDRPQVYAASAAFLLPGSYVARWLTGETAVDYSNASSSLLMDVNTRQYSAELCAAFEIDPARLAPILPADAVLGPLTAEAAERLGLTRRTRLVLGSGDEHAACLGAGVTQPGLVCDIAGTAEPVCAASPQPLFDPTGLVETHCHAHPGLWLLENPGFVSGANLRWFAEHFAADELRQAGERPWLAYQRLDEAAAGVPPGSLGLVMLPCLMGAMAPTWNAAARGVFLGFTLAHERAHFARAVLEASAYAVRDITDQMQRLGLRLTEMRCVGGGARSRIWRQIKADVTGLPVVTLHTPETTSLGAAILALAGSGLMGSLEEAAAAVVQVAEVCEPVPAHQERYAEIYQIYRAAYFSLLPVFEQAARITA